MLDRGLRLHTVLAALALAGVLSWGFGRWWVAGGHAPLRIGWLTAVLLVGMAVIVVAAGRRMWRMRRGRTHVPPIVAERILRLSQASALTGAVIGGLYLGQAVTLAPDIGYAGRGHLALVWAVAGLAALLLTGAGLLVQSWCRVDDDREDDEESSVS
ncbi:hypothetical protein DUHN55_36190 [Helicobacter pylori]|uniref:DUF3180 family protein n=1 Tax=Janibacter sp. G368 TaxID=3420441 RepID=UPI0039DECC3D